MDAELDAQEAARIGGCDGIDEQLPANSPATEVSHHAHAQFAHMALVPTASTNNVAPANHLSLICDRHELRVLVLDVLPHKGRDSFDGWGRIAAKELDSRATESSAAWKPMISPSVICRTSICAP